MEIEGEKGKGKREGEPLRKKEVDESGSVGGQIRQQADSESERGGEREGERGGERWSKGRTFGG